MIMEIVIVFFENCVIEEFIVGYIVMEDDMMMLIGFNNISDIIV